MNICENDGEATSVLDRLEDFTKVATTTSLDPLEKLAQITSTTEDDREPASLTKAKAKKVAKDNEVAVIEKAFCDARDLINPIIDKISLGYKASLDDVINVGEVLNDLAGRFKKARFSNWLPMVGFKLSAETARNYRGIATYKNKVIENRDEFEKAAKADGVAWNYSITDALKMVTEAKKAAAAEKARSLGKPPKLPRTKKTVHVTIKVGRVEGQSVLILSGPTADIEALRSLYAEGISDLNERILESSLIEE